MGTPFYQDGQLRVHVYWQSSTGVNTLSLSFISTLIVRVTVTLKCSKLFFVDPSVEYYRVQWGPEHCAHNETSPTEKTNTRVTNTSTVIII